jgi:AcrR family transcriptional regulator
MARMKDESKRQAILGTAKMLFSQRGFYGTSVSDIVKETGLPVGTIYTYFRSKEEIVRTIVEDGWADLYARLQQAVSAPGSAEGKLKLLLSQFLPELLRDLDLITILLSEAIGYTRIEEKIEALTDLVYSLIQPLLERRPQAGFTRTYMETALAVFFLGILNTVRISRSSSIGIKDTDVIRFIQLAVESSLGVRLD